MIPIAAVLRPAADVASRTDSASTLIAVLFAAAFTFSFWLAARISADVRRRLAELQRRASDLDDEVERLFEDVASGPHFARRELTTPVGRERL